MLKEKIQADVKDALKAGDSQKRLVLGMLLSAIKNRELEKRSKLAKSGMEATKLELESALTDNEALQVLSTEIKKRKESVATYEAGGRPELAQAEKDELKYLETYMPEQFSENEVKELIDEAIASTGASGPKDMGKVMNAISSKIKSRFDGGRASQLVKEKLG